VVYCQMHYGVDAVAGLGIGLTVVWALGARRSPAAIGAPFAEHARSLAAPRAG
jgi:membrane-associated phospholipid phosphatase